MDAVTNALLIDADEPLALPAFDRIRPEHFAPAFEQAMRLHREELDAIATQAAAPGFDNSVAAFDRAGALLQRVEAVFSNLSASATSPELQAVQRRLAAPLAAHWSAVHQDARLFARIDAVLQAQRTGQTEGPTTEGATPEQRRLTERLHADFVRAGAALPQAQRTELASLAARHAELTTQFAQNVLHDEASFQLPLHGAADEAGLPDFVLAAARQAGRERGLDQPVITLSRALIVPFLSFSTRRDLREQAWRAWVARGGQDGAHDNRPIARDILALRQRQARLMGRASYADFKLEDTMAQSRASVWALLDQVWQRALLALAAERALLREAMTAAGAGDQPLEAWDWRFWAERVRQQRYALDESAIKPYFALPNMVAAAFDCAQRLFGIRMQPRPDLQAYHADVAVYEVQAVDDGRSLGLFLHDNFARATKRSGAWMSSLQVQHRNVAPSEAGAVRPVVLNNNNFAKAAPGAPTLLGHDDVRTLFHEFGHALHGLLSDVGYRRLSGTRVLRDFVELPSQLFEHWAEDPGVLSRHARHWQTGEPLPAAFIERLQAARRFGQGYETVRYTASAIADLAAHEAAEPIDDIEAFEQRVMTERGLPPEAGMNHRLPHFQHLFSGDGYAAGYYVYLWAEVLEADAFDAFVEAGDVFDPATAQRLKQCILSRGDSVPPAEAYRAFRGRDAHIEPMLRGRGLV